MSSLFELARGARAHTVLRRPAVVRSAVCVAVALALVAAVVFSSSVRHQLTLSFTKVPPAYTELYFDPELPMTYSDLTPPRSTSCCTATSPRSWSTATS